MTHSIGLRLHDAAGATLRERLRNAKAQGFSCVHLALSKTLSGFTMLDAPALMTDRLAGDVAGALAESGLSVAVLGCYLNLATPDEEALRRTTASYRAHLRFARQIGALVVGTETGAPNAQYRSCPECWTEDALRLLIDRLTPVVRAAEEEGARIAIEPVCRHIVNTPARARQVLETIDSPALCVILDAVNLLTPDNCDRADEVIGEAVRLLGDRIAVMHWKDYRAVSGRPDLAATACGLGEMRYGALAAFAAAHPEIPITLENTAPDNAEATRLFVASQIAAATPAPRRTDFA